MWHQRVKPNTTSTLFILAYIEEHLQSDRESPVGDQYRQQLELIPTILIPELRKDIKQTDEPLFRQIKLPDFMYEENDREHPFKYGRGKYIP